MNAAKLPLAPCTDGLISITGLIGIIGASYGVCDNDARQGAQAHDENPPECVDENRNNAELIYDPDTPQYGEGGEYEDLFTGTGHPCDQLAE